MREDICIVPRDLCTRCGMCAAVCPQNAVILENDGYPKRDPERCIACGIVEQACPGRGVNLPKLTEQITGMPYSWEGGLGTFRDAFVGFASDPNIRSSATSGGIVTALLVHLLDSGVINGAVVVTSDDAHPEKTKAILAKTRSELIASAQSRYVVVPACQPLAELADSDGKYAVVGLPCHVAAYRKYFMKHPALARNVSLIVGLYCGRALEHEATLVILRKLRISLDRIKRIEYRGGEWPGAFRVTTMDGHIMSLNRDIFRYLSKLYCPARCLTCVDYSSELADISVADAWTKEGGQYKYPGGQSLVLARTKRGMEMLSQATVNKAILLQRIPSEEAWRTHEGSVDCRKMGALIRMRSMMARGKQVPDFGKQFFLTIPIGRYLEELLRSSALLMGKFRLSREIVQSVAFWLVKGPPPNTRHGSRRWAEVERLLWKAGNKLGNWWFRW